MLGFSVVGDAEFVDEVDADEVDVKFIAHHELALDFFLVLPLDRDGVDPIEIQVVVAGTLDTHGRMVVSLVVPEVFFEGGPGQTGDGCTRVVEYRDVDPTHLKQDFVPIFSGWSHVQER